MVPPETNERQTLMKQSRKLSAPASTLRRTAILATVAAATATITSFAANNVATCTWRGSATGGIWNDPANWTISRTSGNESLTDAQALASSCAWDISALASGAVITNTSSLTIGGLTLGSNKTVIFEDTPSASFKFAPNVTLTIGSGSTVDCRMRGSSWDYYSGGNDRKVVLVGGGTFTFRPNATFATYQRDYQPCGGSTFRIANGNASFAKDTITPWNSGSTVAIGADVAVGIVNGGDTATKIELEGGHRLLLCGGESSWAATQKMPTRGTGGIVVSSGLDYTAWSGALGHTGYFGLIDGLVNFTGGLAVPQTVEMRADGGGTMSFSASQTLGVISGKGSTGGLAMPDNSTLTVAGDNATAASQFNARISGNAGFVKGGADYTLTLTGDNSWTGATRVSAGTLGISRCNYRQGLVASWTFDDSANLGADSGPSGIPLTFFGGNGTISTQIVNGVGGRPAIHLASPTSANADYQAFRVDGTYMKAANGFSKRSGAMAVSFWMKPDLSKGTTSSYIFRRGSWGTQTEFMLWLNCSTKQFRLSIDNYSQSNASLNIFATAATLGDGNWHHIVASYENQKLQLWFDGSLLGEQTTSAPLVFEKETNNGAPVAVANDNSLIFGNPYDNSAHRFDSLIDDVCVWNHALTTAEVAREYALQGGIASPDDALPTPIAHWRFDDDSDIGKDETGNTHLVVNDDMASPGTPTLTSDYSPFGKALAMRRSLKVEGGGYPAGLPLGEKPFTVSLRMLLSDAGNEWGTFLYWGDSSFTAQKFFRLAYGGSPRKLRVSYTQTGNSGNLTADYAESVRKAAHAWVHYVVTFNPQSYVMNLYRDGALEAQDNQAWVNMPSDGNFYLNWRPGQTGGCCGILFDDVRLYDRELTPYEVRTLSRSLKTGTVGPVLPATSAVTVDSGATLRVDGVHVVSNAISGAGDVALTSCARFGAADWTDFTGRVLGAGELVVAKGASGPLAADSVAVPVSFDDNTLIFSNDNQTRPLARTSGRVMLGDTGTIAMSPSSGMLSGKTFKVAECSSYVGPADTTGWTLSPAEENLRGKFIFENGALWLKMSGGAFVMVIR